MKPIRCVLIEDEIPTRMELEYLIKQYQFIEIVGCASDGDSGYQMIRDAQPDLVLLDISIPGMSGMEIAEKLKYMSRPPQVIFTTAYSEHAVRAYDLGAVDYLLKPYDENRVHLALERVKGRLKAVVVSAPPTAVEKKMERLPCMQNGKTVLVEIREISYCGSENETITVHGDAGEYTSNYTLQEIIEKTELFRIHKSFVVNIGRIREIYPWFNGTYQILMDDREKTELTVSRSYVKALKNILGL